MRSLKIFTAILLVAFLYACHQQVNDSDAYNIKATVPQKFDVSKLHLLVINTSINKKDSTMSILYGNKLAYDQLKNQSKSFKSGSLLALVTWKQQADPHWFGANVPGDFLSIEYVDFNYDKNGLEYRKLLGNALTLTADTLHNSEREAFIINQKPSIMP